MKPTDVISSLKARGVDLWEEGGSLRYRARAGTLTDRDKAALKTHKASILKALSQSTAAASGSTVAPKLEATAPLPDHTEPTGLEHDEQPLSYRLEALDGLPLLLDDRKFIRQRLRRLPVSSYEKVLRMYRNLFTNGMEAEQAPHKKDNAGRYRANTWLLD